MDKFKHPAIQRQESLAPFSRDHYGGLVQAQQLIKASTSDADTRRSVITQFLDAWHNEIAEHFHDEEQLLLDWMQPDDKQKLLDDHLQLRTAAHEAVAMKDQTEPDSNWMLELGQRLKTHIRWEERELFAHLQEQLSPDQLNQLQRQTEKIEQSRDRQIKRD
ncbi:MAG: hypothetical protein CMJ19_01725 [Phycisphaeraceae bacterium]|nr:hypothetical protein [Phycisphaeraceae bacterium]|tara:strand:+ start:784 stop:1269 length:486 start_codon:yes stop_codon:yes gene_type:complete